MSSTAAIVLAAGSSERLGTPKQLVDLSGRPLLERVVTDTMTWPVDHVVVVLGASADPVLDAIDFGDATVAINDDWADGPASSLRVGLDVLTRDPAWERVFVALGDQPGIPDTVPHQLIAAADESQRLAVVPIYRYEWGHPILLDRSLWPRLMTLEGGAEILDLLRSHPDWVETVRFPEIAPLDIDTPDDVAKLRPGKSDDTGLAGSH